MSLLVDISREGEATIPFFYFEAIRFFHARVFLAAVNSKKWNVY